MVKVGIKSLLLSVVISIFLMDVCYAAGSKLIFSDVDVKVGGKTSKNLDDGETIDDEAEPGDTVEFRVETRNNFTSAEDLKIEDISVTVTIEGIDDSDDMEEESQDFNLNPGRDKKITLKFQTPIEVDEDSFDVTIHAEGEDENGTDHEADMRLALEVNKKSHLLKITRTTLSPAEVSCNRRNIQAGISVINIGNEDEEDVSVQILNSDLGVDSKESIGELTAEPNEDESKFSKAYTFNVASDAEAGSYPITLRVLYDDDRKKSEETATLTVNDCAITKKVTTTKEEAEEKEVEGEVELITPKIIADKTTSSVVETKTPVDIITTQESFLKSNALVLGIIIAEVVAIIVGIVLVASLFRKGY